jgi:hypothetical protein
MGLHRQTWFLGITDSAGVAAGNCTVRGAWTPVTLLGCRKATLYEQLT